MAGCKVERVAAEYGVPLDDRLREAHAHGAALRELERRAGVELLRHEVERVGLDVVEGDVRRYYTVLVDGESEVARAQVRRKLARAGIAVDEVLEAVPSYQTIRQHLQDCADRDTSRHLSQDRAPADVAATVRAIEARIRHVVETEAQRLESLPDPRAAHTSTLLTCDGCGETVGVYEFLDGGCGCEG